VALVVYSQASSAIVEGGYSAKLAISLLAGLLIGGFITAVFVFGQAAGSRELRLPALVGIAANLAGAGLISYWLTTA
jgi:hypothetical protein